MLTFNDNSQMMLPVVIESKLLGIYKRKISMVAGTFGGFLYDTGICQEHVKVGLEYLLSKGNWLLRENPYDPFMSNIEFDHTVEDFTQSVDIRSGYEAVFSVSDPTHRNKMRQAIRAGLEVIATESWDEWSNYYAVYEQSMKRWKSKGLSSRSFYIIDVFREIFNLDPSLRKLWVAKSGADIAAGIICFYWNKHVAVWHGSGSEDFFKMRPNNLLYDAALHHACNNGYWWFDCNPSGGYEGVIQFKKHLGAQNMRSRVFEIQSRVIHWIRYIKKFKIE